MIYTSPKITVIHIELDCSVSSSSRGEQEENGCETGFFPEHPSNGNGNANGLCNGNGQGGGWGNGGNRGNGFWD